VINLTIICTPHIIV